MSKKALLSQVLGTFYNFFFRRKIIIFDAPAAFHINHLLPVIYKLTADNQFKIIVVSPISNAGLATNIKFYASVPLYVYKPLFITTEFSRKPFWLTCRSIYFGHGIGPKLNYQEGQSLLDFDYVYSPCLPIYNVQKKIINENKLIKIGLPIVENAPKNKEEFLKFFNLSATKMVIVYAPSWCNDSEKISDIEQILTYLGKQKGVSIIISAHPLLLKPEKCDGKIFFENRPNNLQMNPANSPYTTLDLISLSEGLISDISSVLFEGMALNKIVFFDGNKEIYDYCEAQEVYNELIDFCPIPDWNDSNNTFLVSVLCEDKNKVDRHNFINSYLFNVGSASTKLIQHIKEIIYK
tara:strand:- start:4112 stop:5164 length:1053 start_codon:yes stop_codon:yes gene_type:complete